MRTRNEITRRIFDAGYPSVHAFCRDNQLWYSTTIALISGKLNALHHSKRGSSRWRGPALDLANALRCAPWDLFIDERQWCWEADLAQMYHERVLTPEEFLIKRQTVQTLHCAIKDRLTPRERFVVMRRFALGDAKDGSTLDEIAAALGLSNERVRQIEAKALRRLHGEACRQSWRFSHGDLALD